jgi:transposase
MASPSFLAMRLTTKYVDGLPLHRFEKVLGRHGLDIPCQTLARWVIQCGEHFQPLLNLMRDSLLGSLLRSNQKGNGGGNCVFLLRVRDP